MSAPGGGRAVPGSPARIPVLDSVRDPAPDSVPAAASPLRDFYEDPAVPASSGPDRAYRQAEMLADVLATVPAPARILDVGCGDGFATSVAARRNDAHHFAGLDWSVPSLAQASARGMTVLLAGLDAPLPVRSGSVDVVIMSEVIEHLVDTDSAVEEAYRVLRPGGSLLLSTPNLAAWYNRGLLALGIQPVFSEVSLRSVFGRPGSQVAGHLHMFTRRALVEFLAAYGLECVRVAGARYHDVPAVLRPLDRIFCHWPSAASILLVQARKA
ncbi:MAG TPA: methyltransferase domain-containing protein [Streptosporangiaceae bacterium]|nr:methyltransferase domain-containing protein [Streptosporangiaceae bacterium]